MKSPFEKKFCGKSPLKELTTKQEANLPEALKTAIEANSPNNYGSPLEKEIDPKLAVEMAEKAKQANRYKKYVQGKEKGYIEDNSSDYMSNQAIKPDPSNIMDFNRFVVGEEIARGGKRGSKAYKHHLNVSKAIKAGKELAKGRGY
jgi:protoheme ferro-lyase